MNIVKAKLRNDFRSFFLMCDVICNDKTTSFNDDPYLNILLAYASDIANGKINRAIINLPPGVGKTFIFSVCLVAWHIAHNPSASVLIVMHDEGLAKGVTRKIRDIIESSMFKKYFDVRIHARKTAAGHFQTSAGGTVFASSIGGAITGFRADMVVVDDPLAIKYSKKLRKLEYVNNVFDDEINSRLRSQNKSRMVVVMHRLHEDDLSGHLLDDDRYSVLAIPMISSTAHLYESKYGNWDRKIDEQIRPGEYTTNVLRTLRGKSSFKWLFQQGVDTEDSELSSACFGTHSGFVRSKATTYVIDPSLTFGKNSSCTAIQIWQRDNDCFNLVDVWSEQCSFSTILAKLKKLFRKYPPDLILIENTANGPALLSALKRFTGAKLVPIIPSRRSKEDRFFEHRNALLERRVRLPAVADWSADFIGEMLAFPEGDFDDHIDCLSMFLDYCKIYPDPDKIERQSAISAFASGSGYVEVVNRSENNTGRAIFGVGSRAKPWNM